MNSTNQLPNPKRDWNELKTLLKQRFALLTDDDVLREDGKDNEFYTRLETRLGKTRAEIQLLISSM
jgi:hypothetical protein